MVAISRALLLSTMLTGALLASPSYADSVYLLQLGSFESRDKAEGKWQQLQGKYPSLLEGLSLRVMDVTLPPDNFMVYRTQGGSFASRGDAQGACEQLAAGGDECYVVETAMVGGEIPKPPLSVASASNPVFGADLKRVAPPAVPMPDAPAASSNDITGGLPDLRSPAEPFSRGAELPDVENTQAEPKEQGFWSSLNPFSDDEEPVAKTTIEPAMPAVEAPATAALPTPDMPTPDMPAPETPIAEMPAPPMPEASLPQATEPILPRLDMPAPDMPMPNPELPATQPYLAAQLPSVDTPQPVVPPVTPPVPMAMPAAPEPLINAEKLPSASAPKPMAMPFSSSDARRLPPPPAPPTAQELEARNQMLQQQLAASQPMTLDQKLAQIQPETPQPATQQPDAAKNPAQPMPWLGQQPAQGNPANANNSALNGSSDDVSIAEAIPVPLSEEPRITAFTAAQMAALGTPSSIQPGKTLWAQLNYFTDQQAALGYWEEFRRANPSFPPVRVRVTSPLNQQLGFSRVSLRVGAFSTLDKINEFCDAIEADEEPLNCSVVSDLGGSGNGRFDRGALDHADQYHRRGTLLQASAKEMFWVQLGSFATPYAAQEQWGVIGNKAYPLLSTFKPNIAAPLVGSSMHATYRLRTGPFMQRLPADQLCNSLSLRQTPCMVVQGR